MDTSSQDDGADESAAALPIDHSSPDDGRLLFGSSVNDTDLLHLHPNPTQLFQLWQKYLENVDLLTKVFHTPTVQQQVLSASGDFSGVSKPLEALMFAIYLCAVVSMSDQQCLDTMHESRDVLLRRFRFGTQQALINADLIKTSDLTVLRAFVLYLVRIFMNLICSETFF